MIITIIIVVIHSIVYDILYDIIQFSMIEYPGAGLSTATLRSKILDGGGPYASIILI